MAQLYAPRSFASSLAKEQDRGISGYESALAAPPQMGGAAPLNQRVSDHSSDAFGGMQSRYFQQLQDRIRSLESMISGLQNRNFHGDYGGGYARQAPPDAASFQNQGGLAGGESSLAEKVRGGKHGERLTTDKGTGEEIIDFGSNLPGGAYDASRYGSDKLFMYKGQKYTYRNKKRKWPVVGGGMSRGMSGGGGAAIGGGGRGQGISVSKY